MLESEDVEGTSKVIGLFFNGVLVLLAFILLVVGGYGAYEANDVCKTDDCVPAAFVMIMLIGAGTLVLGGMSVAGIQNPSMSFMLRLATLLMTVLIILLILFAIILGISSGAVMEDTNYYFDQV